MLFIHMTIVIYVINSLTKNIKNVVKTTLTLIKVVNVNC